MKLKTSLFGAKCYLLIKEHDRLQDWMLLRSHSEGLIESAMSSCPQLLFLDIDAIHLKSTEKRAETQGLNKLGRILHHPNSVENMLGFRVFLFDFFSEAWGISKLDVHSWAK